LAIIIGTDTYKLKIIWKLLYNLKGIATNTSSGAE
jgi:hypothetical protein